MDSSDHAAALDPTVRFSTEGLCPCDQFDAWREQIGFRFGLAEVSRKTAGSFRATIETRSVSKLSLFAISSNAMTFERTSHHLALRDRDSFLIGLVLEGGAVVEQTNRSTSLRSGDLVLMDDRRPLRIRFEDPFRSIVFQCDRSQLEARLPDSDRRIVQRIEGRAELVSATAAYVASIARQARGFGAAESIVAQHALEILSFTLGSGSPRDPASQILLARVDAYIEENLSDPGLTPAAIARHHRISRRHLYRLFEEIGDSVASFIRRRRLARCKAILADDLHTKRSISEIAFAWGFNDATTFGRAFRAAFGVTPRDYRRSASAGVGEKG
jgi:AraC-like DNA-binding protein